MITLLMFQPFGRSLMTIVLPQLRHGDSNLVIWSLCGNTANKQRQPVHEFTGFTDVLMDFHWRPTTKGGATLASLSFTKAVLFRLT